MSGTYEPGRLYVATVRGEPDVRVTRSDREAGTVWFTAFEIDGCYDHEETDVTDVRPLVVLDLEDPRRTFADLSSACLATGNSAVSRRLLALRDQIEAQTKPPKPAEPTGLGAVVEDDQGRRYVGLGDHYAGGQFRWKGGPGMTFTSYDRIHAVRVLSEGVKDGD